MRRKSREVKIGNVKIGGNNPIAIQSMTTTDTTNINATVKQILELEEIGCDIIRVSAPTMEAAKSLKEIKANINLPLIADIHFDYRIALEAAKYVDKLRINPGNIGKEDRVKAVVDAAKEYGLPMRIGVNLGSLERDLFEKYGYSAEGMAESALMHVKILENLDFYDIVVSLKASDVPRMVQAYRIFAQKKDYPLHLGVTEAGSKVPGAVKSSMGMGILLSEGIGDTIRVSLSEEPKEEVRVAKLILRSLGLRNDGVEVTSCPTCARTHVDVMGCAVNGPGESKKVDLGIVGGAGNTNLLYKDGKIIGKVEKEKIVETLMKEIDRMVNSS